MQTQAFSQETIQEQEHLENSLKHFFLHKYDFDHQIHTLRMNLQKQLTASYQDQVQNIICGVDIKKNKLLHNLYIKLNKIEANFLIQNKDTNQNKCTIKQNLYQQLNEYKLLIESFQLKNSCGQIERVKEKLTKLLIKANKYIQNSIKQQEQTLKLKQLIQEQEKSILKLQEQILQCQQETNMIEREFLYQKNLFNIY